MLQSCSPRPRRTCAPAAAAVTDDGVDVVEDLIDEGHHLPTWTCTKCLLHFWAILMKVSQAMSCTPSWVSERERERERERGAFQLIYTLIRGLVYMHELSNNLFLTVHELKQLVDDSLEELPVGPEESWVLTDDVHDVGGDDGLVIFPSFLFTQTQQVLRQKQKFSVGLLMSLKSLFCSPRLHLFD